MSDLHRLSVEEALRALRSGPGGLDSPEAARRLAEFGPNDVARVVRRSPLHGLLGELTHFLALVLWLAAGLAWLAERYNPGEGMGTLALAIVGVIVVNGLFSFAQAHRAERALEALERLLPARVQAVRGGEVGEIEARELVPGDVVLLAGGDRVPADARLVEAFGLRVNNATLTGESVAVALETGASDSERLIRAQNVALAGTSVVSGHGRALVFATGAATELSSIAHLAQTTRTERTPLEREIARVTRLVAFLATLLGAVFFAVGELIGLPFWANVLFAIGIIVANVPEGLLPTVTLALAMAAQRMARRNALVRHLPAVEALGAASVILTDKTGTLTQNRMAVRRLYLGGELHEVGERADLTRPGARWRSFFEACLMCENIQETGGPDAHELLGDPMEVALVETARAALGDGAAWQRVDELPFDADRRCLSTLSRGPDGLVLHTKGAPEAVLERCELVLLDRTPQPLDDAGRARLRACAEELGEQGLRVLAVAARAVAEGEPREGWERGLTLLGLVALEDPPRPEVAAAIGRCRSAGIRVVMVTGDHPRTALAIARQVGLVQGASPAVIGGDELRRMSDSELQLALDRGEVHFARVDAEQKRRLVAAFQRKGEVVAVTGDGVNDAPALKLADVGVAMGLSGTDVARASADLVLADDNFASIVSAIEEGRAVYANIRKFLTYILTSNVPEIVPYLLFVLLRIPLPLTIIQILAVDLGTDMLPALGLGAEPPDPEAMRRPPRPRNERLLTARLLGRAYLFLGLAEAVAAIAAYAFVLERGGWSYGQPLGPREPLYRQATTACLAAIVLMQVVNVFLCRRETGPIFGPGLGGNRLIRLGVLVELLLLWLVVYTPALNHVFGTHPIGAEVWLFILPFPAGMALLELVRRRVARRWWSGSA